jgi:hypothetical protein
VLSRVLASLGRQAQLDYISATLAPPGASSRSDF